MISLITIKQAVAQDLIVTYSGDSMNVKIGRIFSDKILYQVGTQKGMINAREVSSFQRDYYKEPSKVAFKPEKPILHLGLNYSWAYRLGKVPNAYGYFMQDFQKRLKSGKSYGVEIGFYVNNEIALGFIASKYTTSLLEPNVMFQLSDGNIDTNIIGPYSENISISYYAPTFYYKQSNYAETVNFLFSASIGVASYKNTTDAVIINQVDNKPENGQYTVEGSTLSLGFGFSADFELADHFYIGPAFTIRMGNITDFSYNDKYSKGTITVPGEGESISRITLGGSLKIYI